MVGRRDDTVLTKIQASVHEHCPTYGTVDDEDQYELDEMIRLRL